MSIPTPTPETLAPFWHHGFDLEAHLQQFLHLPPEILRQRLHQAQADLAQLGHRDFDWQQATQFYQDHVGTIYILELAAWHLSSRDYIGDTLRLIDHQARGVVLDFGGGIGTHALGAALCPQVERVVFWDLNPQHRDLVQFRAEKLGLTDRITCPDHAPTEQRFDTILCFDVIEHLPDPAAQLLQFESWLRPQGQLILNWYFFKGFRGEFPFHLEDPVQVERFFRTLQTRFLEVFHPFLITTRCYRRWPEDQTP